MEAGKLSSGLYSGNRVGLVLMLMLVMLLAACAGVPPGPPRPTPEEVVQWSREKMAPAQIIQCMRDSHAAYRLSASSLARLHDQGVDDAVIDYMHETHLAAVRREIAAHRFDNCFQLFPCDAWPPGLAYHRGWLGYGSYPWGR